MNQKKSILILNLNLIPTKKDVSKVLKAIAPYDNVSVKILDLVSQPPLSGNSFTVERKIMSEYQSKEIEMAMCSWSDRFLDMCHFDADLRFKSFRDNLYSDFDGFFNCFQFDFTVPLLNEFYDLLVLAEILTIESPCKVYFISGDNLRVNTKKIYLLLQCSGIPFETLNANPLFLELWLARMRRYAGYGEKLC